MPIDQLRPDARLSAQHTRMPLDAIIVGPRPCIVGRLSPESVVKVPRVLGRNNQFVAEVQQLLGHVVGRRHPRLDNVPVFGQKLFDRQWIGQVTGPHNSFGQTRSGVTRISDVVPSMQSGFLRAKMNIISPFNNNLLPIPTLYSLGTLTTVAENRTSVGPNLIRAYNPPLPATSSSNQRTPKNQAMRS